MSVFAGDFYGKTRYIELNNFLMNIVYYCAVWPRQHHVWSYMAQFYHKKSIKNMNALFLYEKCTLFQ